MTEGSMTDNTPTKNGDKSARGPQFQPGTPVDRAGLQAAGTRRRWRSTRLLTMLARTSSRR